MENPESSQNYSETHFYSEFIELLNKTIPAYQSNVSLFNNQQFRDLFDNAPGIVGIYNYSTLKYEYFSNNVKSILGYDKEEYLNGGLAFGMSTFHPTDAKIFSENVLPLMLEYFKLFAPRKELKSIVYRQTFRVRKKNGEYQWFLQHMNFIETTDEGYPLLSTIFMFDINDVKKDDCINFSISQKDKDGIFCTIFKKEFPESKIGNRLSEREIEILRYLGNGKSSNEIAQILCISPHTVNTHRKKMLEKTKMNNTVELLKFAMTKGLI